MVRATTGASGLLVYFSNLVYQNHEWDWRTFNFDSDMTRTDDAIGRMGNATSTDYSAAVRRGVKIIQYHGWNDQTLQPAYSPQYYEHVAGANGGLETTQQFYRLFMVPGMNHCSGGVGASSFGGIGVGGRFLISEAMTTADCEESPGMNADRLMSMMRLTQNFGPGLTRIKPVITGSPQ